MAHYFITRFKIFFLLLFNYFLIIFLIKFSTFKNLIKYLNSLSVNNSKLNIDKKIIFRYDRRISKILKINQCLISACCLFKTYRQLGFETILFFGVKNDESFSSHAWIEVEEAFFLYDEKEFFKKILTIK